MITKTDQLTMICKSKHS